MKPKGEELRPTIVNNSFLHDLFRTSTFLDTFVDGIANEKTIHNDRFGLSNAMSPILNLDVDHIGFCTIDNVREQKQRRRIESLTNRSEIESQYWLPSNSILNDLLEYWLKKLNVSGSLLKLAIYTGKRERWSSWKDWTLTAPILSSKVVQPSNQEWP